MTAIGQMEAGIATEIAEAFEFALNSPNPTADDLDATCTIGSN